MRLFKRSFGFTRSLSILYVHEHDRLGFGMLTMETTVFDCICWFSSSRDRKGQCYPVEYCLESVEEYSEGKIHKSMRLFKRSFGFTRSLSILYIHEHDRRGFSMLTMETAVFDCICWFRSSRNRKGQCYPVEYCLESVEEYSEGKIHESGHRNVNRNVNTVYFISQAGQGKTRISRTEFVYGERARDCKCLLIFELPA